MKPEPPVHVRADPARNLVTVTFAGEIGVADMALYERELRAALLVVQTGFFLLTDLTRVHAMDPASIPAIEKTMDLIREHGVGRVVRVIPNPRKDIGFSIMSLFHYPRGLPIITCKTMAEAQSALT